MRRIVLGVLFGLFLIAAAGLLVISVFFKTYKLPSAAMEPTLAAGDRILTRAIDGEDAHRGNIIIFDAPPGPMGGPPGQRVSRVIAVAGDRIEVVAGRVHVNGEEIEEPYLAPNMETTRLEATELPTATVFVMGDNRSNSQDSRSYGPLPTSTIQHRVVIEKFVLDRWLVVFAAVFGVAALAVLLVTRAQTRIRRDIDEIRRAREGM